MILKSVPTRIWSQWLPACGIAAVIAYYAFFLYRHALNVPYQDDIFDVLLFLTNVLQATDMQQAFGAFFENYNEHRTLASRLVYYLVYLVEGEISFRTLLFLAALSLIAQLYLLHLAIHDRSKSLLLLLPAALILLQPRAYGLLSLSMGAFAYMFVYLYGFASLMSLREVKVPRFMAAIMFAALGTFTLASGQLIWLVGLASLLHQSLILRRCSLSYVLIWCLSAAVTLVVWRIGYDSPTTMSLALGTVLDSPTNAVKFLFTLMGAALTKTNIVLAVCAGGSMLGVVCYWSIRNLRAENISLELFAWYVVLTMAAITIGRVAYYSSAYAMESRLSFHSQLLLMIVVVLCLSQIRDVSQKLKTYTFVLLCTIVYSVVSFRTYPAFMQAEFEHRVSAFNKGLYWVIYFPLEETKGIVDRAIALDIYHPPARPLPVPAIAPHASGKALDYTGGGAAKNGE